MSTSDVLDNFIQPVGNVFELIFHETGDSSNYIYSYGYLFYHGSPQEFRENNLYDNYRYTITRDEEYIINDPIITVYDTLNKTILGPYNDDFWVEDRRNLMLFVTNKEISELDYKKDFLELIEIALSKRDELLDFFRA